MARAALRNTRVVFQWTEIFLQTNAYSCLCSASLTVHLSTTAAIFSAAVISHCMA